MNPVVHFEMPAEDKNRMCDFYSKVFGWKTKTLGQDMGGYVLVTTTETDEENGRPVTPGAINGGFYLKTDDPVSQHTSLVVAVDNLDDSVKKVNENGGKTHGEAYDIPGVGRYISVIDTEGNHISLLQPVRM